MDTIEEIFLRTGTDKFGHKYAPAYEYLVGHLRDTPVTLLEIGACMGYSLRAWELIFPNAKKIVGIDIDDECVRLAGMYDAPMTTVKRIDQTKVEELQTLQEDAPYDVIIDDGSHYTDAQELSYSVLWPMLKVGGVYVIEDLELAWSAPHRDKNGLPMITKILHRVYTESQNGVGDRISVFAGGLAAFIKTK
jgi:8-demethyl-8-alpha-L-rhamnosyltetracenomycin-C 2'-O-methyltransferase